MKLNIDKIDNTMFYMVLFIGVTDLIINASVMILPLVLLLLIFINFNNYKTKIFTKENSWIMGLIILAIIFSFFSDGGTNSALQILRKSYRFIPLIIFPAILTNFDRISKFIYSLGIAIVINFIKGMYVYKQNNFNFNLRFQSFRGIMDNSHSITVLSFLMLGMLIYYIKEKNKKMVLSYSIFYLLSIIIVFLSKTRGSWLALGIFIPLFLFFVDKKKTFAFVLLGILSLFLVLNTSYLDNNVNVQRIKSIKNFNQDSSPKSRILMWEAGLEIAKKHPVVGVGRKNSSKFYLEYLDKLDAYSRIENPNVLKQNATGANPHNMYVNTMVENGFIILALLLSLGLYFFIKNIKLLKKYKKNKLNEYYIVVGILCGTLAYYTIGFIENNFVVLWAFINFSILLIILESMNNIEIFKRKNNLEKIETSMDGLYLIKTKRFKDERGNLLEAYNKINFEKIGINDNFVQDNFTVSSKGVLRGLHFQKTNSQSKLIRVVKGKILDVVVDLRKDSETFSKISTFELSMENDIALYIPKGMAHGFLSLEDNTIVCYKCGDYFNPSIESGIIWNDKDLNIDWKLEKYSLSKDKLILSKKDKKQKTFKEIIKEIKF